MSSNKAFKQRRKVVKPSLDDENEVENEDDDSEFLSLEAGMNLVRNSSTDMRAPLPLEESVWRRISSCVYI